MTEFSDSSEYVLIPRIVKSSDFFNTEYKETELYFITKNPQNADIDLSGVPQDRGECFCSVGYRIRSSKDGGMIPVREYGFSVEYLDIRWGILIPGSVLAKKSWVKGSLPSDMNIGLWLSINIRNENKPIYTVGNDGKKTNLSPEVFEQCLKKYGKFKEVSIITPTYNRHHFLSRLLACIEEQERQTFEWIMLDDSPKQMPKEQQDKIWGKVNFPVLYVWQPKKICVGNKRNILSGLSRGNVIINFDDDDLHHPKRISHSITRMNSVKCDIVGSTRSLIYHEKLIYQIKPFGNYHSTGGLMAFKREHGLCHSFGENTPNAEEGPFTDMFTIPLAQLDPNKVILIISHSENTYNKDKWIKESLGKTVELTKLKVNNFTRNKKLRKLFKVSD